MRHMKPTLLAGAAAFALFAFGCAPQISSEDVTARIEEARRDVSDHFAADFAKWKQSADEALDREREKRAAAEQLSERAGADIARLKQDLAAAKIGLADARAKLDEFARRAAEDAPAKVEAEPEPAPARPSVEERLADLARTASPLDWEHSIVDFYKLLGWQSSLDARRSWAINFGAREYEGSARENEWLHAQTFEYLRRVW